MYISLFASREEFEPIPWFYANTLNSSRYAAAHQYLEYIRGTVHYYAFVEIGAFEEPFVMLDSVPFVGLGSFPVLPCHNHKTRGKNHHGNDETRNKPKCKQLGE